MNERTRQGLKVLEAALLLGILGDALLRGTPWGLNFALWVGVLAVAAFLALPARRGRAAYNREGRWLIPVALFFACALAWRDSLTLNALAFCATLVALALAAFIARGGPLRLAGVMDYALGLILAGFDAAFGVFALVFGDVRWKEIPRTGWSKHALAVARGLLIAAPLLLIFGGLLTAADAVFEGLVNKTLNINPEKIFGHAFLVVFFGWVAGGFLRGMFFAKSVTWKDVMRAASLVPAQPTTIGAGAQKNDVGGEAAPGHRRVSLGITEIGVVLGLLDALFLAFVLVQIHYFFGGAALAKATPGLTYAEYARRGFFELVWVAALALPLLLAAHWLVRKENPLHERVFRALAGGMVALLFVIMASALGRMRVYQSGYGLTELRLYTTAFMFWLAAVFVWFVLTVLRGQRERFACGALVTAFVAVAALHLINPDAMIVRANLDRLRDRHDFDAVYAASLSADAVPVLVRDSPGMSEQERCVVSRNLLDKWSQPGTDWRTWNWSRREARARVGENVEVLRALACAPQSQTTSGP
ncbi:MAG TPA: DUF4173 domain-containing protein [Pyrinomonadaceae bacterium]|jgi:hypothetical protein